MDVSDHLDLAPRTSADSERPVRRSRRWLTIVIVAGLLVAAFVAVRSLSSASVFFYTVDEAVARHAELGESRFRIEGMVVPDTIASTPEGVTFSISNGNEVVAVTHLGDPPQMFQPCIPVVLEGRFASTTSAERFSSELMLVKHSEEYVELNSERLEEAEAPTRDCWVGQEAQ